MRPRLKDGCSLHKLLTQNNHNKTDPTFRLGNLKQRESKQIRDICFLKFGNTAKTGNCLNIVLSLFNHRLFEVRYPAEAKEFFL
jgi:hypothetical protein